MNTVDLIETLILIGYENEHFLLGFGVTRNYEINTVQISDPNDVRVEKVDKLICQYRLFYLCNVPTTDKHFSEKFTST